MRQHSSHSENHTVLNKYVVRKTEIHAGVNPKWKIYAKKITTAPKPFAC